MTVFLHRGRAGLLLCGDLLPRLRYDQHLWQRVRAYATEAGSLGLHCLRCRSNDHPGRGSCISRHRLFQPGGPDDTEQHPARWSCFPGFLVCGLLGRTVLDLGKS